MVPGYPTVIAASSAPMSMPNSSALVLTTASSRPPNSMVSMLRRCSGVYPAR